MMASNLVIVVYVSRVLGRHIEGVTFFAMLREVQSLNLFILGDAQADRNIDNLQDDDRPYNPQSPGDGNANELVEQLMGVAIDQSGGEGITLGVLENRIHRRR